MTTVEIEFQYLRPPSEAATLALAHISEVYGVRGISFHRETRTLRIEYDATRLNAASVAALVRRAGLEIKEPEPSETEPAPAAS